MSTDDKNKSPAAPEDGQKPFWLEFSFDDSDTEVIREVLEPDVPKSKGEVYFANPTRTFQPASSAPAPAAKNSGKNSKKKKNVFDLRSNVPMIILLSLVLVATIVLSVIGISTLRDIFALGKSSDDATIVNLSIPEEQTTDGLIEMLAENKLISQRAMCKLYMRFAEMITSQNVDGEPEPPLYVAGEYELNSAMGLEEMLGEFMAKPKSSETASLLFPEGYTIKQIMDKIGENRVTNISLLNRSMLATEFKYSFLEGLDTSGRYYKYEGYLFPDTYEFYIDENANSALQRFFDNFQSKWDEKYTTRAKEMGYTIDQIVILASIIQKEAANADQMKNVSGVLHNRLNHPSVYPLLECDSTRDYVLNNIATEMDAGAAELYHETYNTYRCPGLPVGPICNPGLSAIEAALYPASNDYFYFQHDKNGKIYLSKTKAEHNKITTQLIIDGLAQ